MLRLRDPFCGISHALGAALALVGAVVLLALSWGKPTNMVAFGVYGASLVGLYTASAMYHSLRLPERLTLLLRKFDHAGIFLLIAGTYVPVAVLALGRPLAFWLLAAQGVCAAVGIGGTFVLKRFPSVLNVVLYLVMGWMAVAALGYISRTWPAYATAWLVAGGLTYTVGAVIYALDRPHLVPGRFGAHDLWHVFVLGGSACHFLLMLTYVVWL